MVLAARGQCAASSFTIRVVASCAIRDEGESFERYPARDRTRAHARGRWATRGLAHAHDVAAQDAAPLVDTVGSILTAAVWKSNSFSPKSAGI